MKKKIVIVGHFGVGKTSLTRQFVSSIFSEKYLTTIGVNIENKIVETTQGPLKLIIWDVAGEEELETIKTSYLKGAHGFLLVTDLTREKTYSKINKDIAYMQNIVGDVPYLTIGNKSDLVHPDQVQKIKTNYNIDYISSAKTGENVNAFFIEIAEKLMK